MLSRYRLLKLTCLYLVLQLHTTVIRDGAVKGLRSYARAGAGLQGLSRHRLLTGEGEYLLYIMMYMTEMVSILQMLKLKRNTI